MKKIYLSVLFILGLHFALFGQTAFEKVVTLKIEDQPISEALFLLSDAADINIAFTKEIFETSKNISFFFERKTVRQALRYILRNTGVGFKLKGKSILLYQLPKKKVTISGYLTDAETGEQLIGAHIYEINNQIGETSNAYGFYSLTLPQGKNKFEFSYLGYQSHFETINIRSNRSQSIALKPSVTLTEVVIKGSTKETTTTTATNHQEINDPLFQQLPSPGGEADLLRQLQYLPGVQTGADGFGGLHVRGGNTDQNLILLDDVPIYNPSHSFGLFSIFNSDMVRSARFWKGGFPAHYGGRLSSVLDIRTREGNSHSFGGEATVGFLASKLVLEGPLIKNKGAFLLTARRTHQDGLIKNLSRKSKEKDGKAGETAYYFLDLNAKMNYAIGKNDRLYISFYNGGDSFRDTTSLRIEELNDYYSLDALNYNYEWGNQIVSLRWNHLYGARLFSNITLISSRFNYESDVKTNSAFFFSNGMLSQENFQIARFQSVIEDKAVRIDFDYFKNEKLHVRFGGSFHRRSFSPGIFTIDKTLNSIDSMAVFVTPIATDTSSINTSEMATYIEWKREEKDWKFNIGLYNSVFFTAGKTFISFQPRFNISRLLKKNFSINGSITNVSQNLHLLTTSDAGLPNDLWVPATQNAGPQEGWIFTTGFNWQLKENWQINFEGYYKKMKGLLAFNESIILNETAQNIDARNWEEFATSGTGKSYGLEYSIEKQKGQFTGLIAYTLAWSKRNFGNTYVPFQFDNRHNLSIILNHQINPAFSWTISWSYQSGLPLDGFQNSQDNLPFLEVFPHESKIIQGDRMPSYHRMDAGINYNFGRKKWKHRLSIGAYNLYNRKNNFLAYPNQEMSSQSNWMLVRALPILPSFRYSLKFKN